MDGPTEGSTEYSRPDLASRPRPRKPDGSPGPNLLNLRATPASRRPARTFRESIFLIIIIIIIIIVRQTGAEPSLTVEI